jgi:CRISPR/Cas system-associated endonuclease/helicase Cas3
MAREAGVLSPREAAEESRNSIVSLDQADFTRRGQTELADRMVETKKKLEKMASEWDTPLSLFGTEKARKNFVDLCQKYKNQIVLYKESAVKQNYAGEYKNTVEHFRKSDYHLEIMKILNKLKVAKQWPPEIERLLTNLQDGKLVEALVDEVYQYRP